MPLSDREIWMELEAGSLVIDPMPDVTQVGPASIDLCLGAIVHLFKDVPPGFGPIRLKEASPTRIVDFVTETWDLRARPLTLNRGDFAIGYTNEDVQLPTHLSARVEGRSGFARLGLTIHNTAPTIHPGFRGKIALELHNNGHMALQLEPGIIICQLIIENLGRPAAAGYSGVFQNQSGPTS